MRVHIETLPKDASFIGDYPKERDRKDLASRLLITLADYELDWAAVYIHGKQYMFYQKDDLIKALKYDKYT